MRPGLSLIEIIVYIAILAVLSTIALNTLLLIHSSLAEIRVMRSLNAAAAVAMERTTRTIRDAKAVNISGSTLGASPGLLSLTGSESAPRTYVFSRDAANALTLDSGSGPAALTPTGIAVTKLVFHLIAAGSTTQAVKVELTLSAATRRTVTEQNFFNTAVLRGSYAP